MSEVISIAQLEEQLAKLPGRIRDQKLVVIEKEKEYENAKLEYNVAMGMTVLTSKAPNATEKKAKATVETQEDFKKVIEAEYNLKKEEAARDYLTDKFIAVRKITSLEQEIMRSQLGGQ